jgi:hypothetical protein
MRRIELRRENESFNSLLTTRKDLSNRDVRLCRHRRPRSRNRSHDRPLYNLTRKHSPPSSFHIRAAAEEDADADAKIIRRSDRRTFLVGEKRSTSSNELRANDFEAMKALQFTGPIAVSNVPTMIRGIRTMMSSRFLVFSMQWPLVCNAYRDCHRVIR